MMQLFRLRLRRDGIWTAAAVLLALCVVLAGVVYWTLAAPSRWRIAVPAGGPEAASVAAYARAVNDRKGDVRLAVSTVGDARAAAAMMERREVELAVVRPDLAMPADGLSLAIVREEALLIIAPARSGIEDPGDLAGKKLGIVFEHPEDESVLRAVLLRYDLGAQEVTWVTLNGESAEAAALAGEVDAVATLATPAGRRAGAFVRNLARAWKGDVTVVPVQEAEAMAAANPSLVAVTVPAGSFGGRPRRPDDEIKTLGVAWRLVARADLDRGPVASLLQSLFQLRTRAVQTANAAQFLKPPEGDVSTSAPLPNHPGAVDYFNRETQTFMDRYGDWIWILLFIGGGLSSAGAWTAQFLSRQRRQRIDDILDGLLRLLRHARVVETEAGLRDVAAEIDRLVVRAVRDARRGRSDTSAMGALVLAIDSARAAVDDRRRELTMPLTPRHEPHRRQPVSARWSG